MSENKTIANRLPEKLALLRRHFQYSQADVAAKLSVSVSDYMNWENGNSICTIAQLKQLSRLFQVNMGIIKMHQGIWCSAAAMDLLI